MGSHVKMPCGWGCGESFGARSMAAHFKVCRCRPSALLPLPAVSFEMLADAVERTNRMPGRLLPAALRDSQRMDELYRLRESHADALRRGDKSGMVRKGWQSIVDGRMLTDEELAFVGVAQPLPDDDVQPARREHRGNYIMTTAEELADNRASLEEWKARKLAATAAPEPKSGVELAREYESNRTPIDYTCDGEPVERVLVPIEEL